MSRYGHPGANGFQRPASTGIYMSLWEDKLHELLFFSDLSRSNSPSLAVVADTPITPTMKDRIERMRREEKNTESGGQSPTGIGRQKPALLQKRLFEKLAKDIFSRESSDEDDEDTTARVVAKLIDGLESQEEDNQSPKKRMRRMSSHEKVQEQLDKNVYEMSKVNLSQKSPRRKMNSPNHCQHLKDETQPPPSPRRRSLRISPQKNQTTPGSKGTEDASKIAQRSSIISRSKDPCQSIKPSSLPGVSSTDVNERKPSDPLTNKRKKMLLSESNTFSTLVDQQQNCSHAKQSETSKTSKKKEKEKLSEEISLLFGLPNKQDTKVATNRRRSARLSVVKNAYVSSSINEDLNLDAKKKISLSKNCIAQLPSENSVKDCTKTDMNAASTSHQSVNDSMSVVYEQAPSILNESSTKNSSRRSIDEFSLQSMNNSHKNSSTTAIKKRNRRQSNLGCVTETTKVRDSASAHAETNEEEVTKSGRMNKSNCNNQLLSLVSKSKLSLSQSDTGSSEDENLPRKLRHVNSLVMEMSRYPQPKRCTLSLVMTSLHKDEQETVLSVVKSLGVFKVTHVVDENTTHVVCGETRRTLNLLRAITRGCWVLKKEWVLESLEANKWLLEEDFEMVEEFPVVKTTRCNRMKKGRSYQTDLFSTFGPMFVAKTCTPPRKDLIDLITHCSGTITQSQQRAAIFIDDGYSHGRMNIKPTWILDSIMQLKALDKEDYVVQGPMTQNGRECSPEF